MPRLSVNLNDSIYAEVVRLAEESSVSTAAWAAMAISKAVKGEGSQSLVKSNPGPTATPSSEKRPVGRPPVGKTAAQKRKEEAILSRDPGGRKGGLCPGSRKEWPPDPGAHIPGHFFGVCGECEVGGLAGLTAEGGKVLVCDHGDGKVPDEEIFGDDSQDLSPEKTFYQSEDGIDTSGMPGRGEESP